MTRTRSLAVVGAVLALAVPAAADDGGPPRPAHAFGAGTFGPGCPVDPVPPRTPFCTPFAFTFRLLAVARGDDRAWGTLERRNDGLGTSRAGTVTCLRVEGRRAAIGGYLTSGPDLVGEPYVIWVEDDRSISGGGAPDRISHLLVLPAGDPELAEMPRGFPRVCPGATPVSGWFELTSGDVAVEARSVTADG